MRLIDTIDIHPVMTILAVITVFVAVGGLAFMLRPSREESQRGLEQKIAACRSIGGEPRLGYDNGFERFYLNECWLQR